MSGATINCRERLMPVVMGRLISAGIPVQLTRRRTVAETPVSADEVRRELKHIEGGRRVLVLDGTSLQHAHALASPVEAGSSLGPCHSCGALRSEPCRTPGNRTRAPHRGRQP